MSEIEALFPEAGAIPEAFRVDPDDNRPVYLIDGKVSAYDGETAPVHSPVGTRSADEFQSVLLGHEAQLTAEHAELAVAAAERAWGDGMGPWPSASAEERIAAIEKLAGVLDENADRIARVLMYEIGKPYPSAKKEVVRSVEYIRETNAIVRALDAESRTTITGLKGSTTHHARERREPLGKILCVAPFNYPVNELLTTVVPVLVMGNVIVAKTPRFGMLANLVVAEAFAQCFPPGVVNILPGDGRTVIPPIMQAARADTAGGAAQGRIDMLAFIGSEGAANAIMGHHPSPVSLHKVLGLGSKNAAILLPGADIDRAVATIVKGSLGFNGQRCTAEKLIFVPRAEADRFVDRFTAAVESLHVGMPWEDDVAITPLPEPGKTGWMREYIDDATSKGARITNAGGGDAYESLMRPAVLYPVTSDMRIHHEEQFGPIVPIATYDDVGEALRWQQQSPYGQQVGIWGPSESVGDLVRAMRPQTSRININDKCQRGPDSFGFTATDKSGFGILSLRDALYTFSRPVLVQSTDPDIVATVSAT
jgi:glyceraldehyde-3-phosphate dehydrogenase (NADP+)